MLPTLLPESLAIAARSDSWRDCVTYPPGTVQDPKKGASGVMNLTVIAIATTNSALASTFLLA